MKTMKLVRAILTGVALLTTLWGCGNGNSSAPPFLGAHPSGWIDPQVHGTQITTLEQCTECHGPDLMGSISKFNCISCHWQDAVTQTAHIDSIDPSSNSDIKQPWQTVHGLYAKLGSSGRSQAGFVTCQNCHGRNLSGSVLTIDRRINPSFSSSGQIIGCTNVDCHKMWLPTPGPYVYPFPPGTPFETPPHGSVWNDETSELFSTHKNTDPSNASGCLVCHAKARSHIWLTGAAFSPDKWVKFGNLSSPVNAADINNGCFNNSLCHGSVPLPRPLPTIP